MAIIRIRDDNGNITDIPSLRGPKGDPADLTQENMDKLTLKVTDTVTESVKETLDEKQDTLEYDSEPTQNSEKMVKSGGIYTYIDTTLGNINALLQTI